MLTHDRPVSAQSFAGQLLRVTILSTAGRSTIQVRGELDLSTAAQITGAVTRLVDEGHRFIQLDLKQLQFIDAAGLEALLEAHNALRAVHGEFVITNVPQLALRLVKLTGLDDVLFIAG